MAFSDVEILREWRNIDILIIDHTNKFIFLIENKIYGRETRGQLVKYRELVELEFPGFSIVPIFLTLAGQKRE
jgi:hypothetical protein